MNTRIQHDAAFAIAQASIEVVGDFVPDQHRKMIWGMLYQAAKSGIEAYEIYADRMLKRLRPLSN